MSKVTQEDIELAKQQLREKIQFTLEVIFTIDNTLASRNVVMENTLRTRRQQLVQELHNLEMQERTIGSKAYAWVMGVNLLN